MAFSSIPDVLDDLKSGKMIVLVDDEDRENEGDLVVAAEKVTPAAINFMVTHARGVLCLALTAEQCAKLHLHPQTDLNTAQLGTAFTVTVDAHPKFGVTTGVSARDRAKTIEVAIAEDAQPQDLLRPGHINPLKAAKAACSSARDRPKEASTSRASPVSNRRRSSARSCVRTARWPAGRSSKNSAPSTASACARSRT
jgi:3,4-dihydroxy-2-butanone 4-phosphate synthase